MADVPGKFYRATKVRTGVAPSSAGSIEGEVLPPVNPPGSSLNSVGLTMPSAFTVSNSPLTANGTIGVAGAGTVAQYIRGDGSLADFPESSGGGSSVSYYLNGSVNQGTIGGIAYKELSKVPILGTGTDFTINADGYIASFITDAGDPSLLEIPGGNWNFETYFSASSSGGTPTFYVELYKVSSGGTATLIASSSSSPELIAFGTNLNPYFSTLAVPTTTLALTDRLAVRYYVTHSGRTITLHTENNHLCQIITTFTTGLTALNGLTAQVQNFAVGTTGTDFNIASATATHTFNLPTASATNRGALSSADWSTFNAKQNALTLTTTGTSGAATLVGATLNIPNYGSALSGYVPYTGATSNVALGIYSLSLSNLSVNNILANNDGLNDIGSLAGNKFRNVYASSFVKTGGTSSEYLKADGSVSTLTNPVTGTGVSGRVAYWNGTNSITSDADLLFNGSELNVSGIKIDGSSVPYIVSTLAGNDLNIQFPVGQGLAINNNGAENIARIIKNNFSLIGASTIQTSTGNLTISTAGGNGNIILSPHGTGTTSITSSLTTKNASTSASVAQFSVMGAGEIVSTGSLAGFFWENRSGGVTSNSNWYGWYTSAGIIRLYNGSTDILEINGSSGAATFDSSITANSIIRSGGTSSQYLMADGSVSTLSNPVTGTGTTNYLPKFTGSTTIGNSIIQDAGTRIDVAGVLRLTPSSTTDIQAYTGSAYSNLFYDAASHNWQTSGGTAKMTLTASGNLLIGTISDNGARLQVNGTSTFSGTATFSLDIIVNGVNVGKGGGSITTNTRIGTSALNSNTTGSSNTAVGFGSLQTNTTGTNNTAIGLYSLLANTTGVTNTAVGVSALTANTTGNGNSAFGLSALALNTTGTNNSALGLNALVSNTTGGTNTSLGFSSLGNNTTGSNNAALGSYAGSFVTGGGPNNTSSNSVYLGADSRGSASGNTNEIVIGYDARGQGSNSTVIGNSSITKTILNGNVGIATLTPGYRFTVGIDTETSTMQTYTNGTGGANQGAVIRAWTFITENYRRYTDIVAIGNWDGTFGTSAMRFFTQGNSTTPTERMQITSTGRGLFGTQTPSAGANGFQVNSFQVKDEIVSIGSTAGLFWENRSGGVTVNSNWYGWYTTGGVIYLYNGASNIASINSSTGAYTALSDINKKENFETSEIGLKEVLNLKPTIYSIKDDTKKERHLGFIAQEVKQYIPQAYIENDEFIGLNEMPIIAALTKAIQELKQEIDTLKN